jgi:hypothetical protein
MFEKFLIMIKSAGPTFNPSPSIEACGKLAYSSPNHSLIPLAFSSPIR